MFDSITNRAEYFSDHYLNARLAADLADLRAAWDAAEGKDQPTARRLLRGAPKAFFDARAAAVEAGRSVGSTIAKQRRIEAIRALNDAVLAALGFGPANGAGRTVLELPRAGGTDSLVVEAAAVVDTPTGLLLVALDCGLATDVDQLFDATPFDLDDEASDAGILLEPLRRDGGTKVVFAAADAPGELFSVDDAPRFVLLCAGTVVLLAERSKWAEGRFLAVDLDAALERVDAKAKGELETIAALFSADALVPGHLGGDESAVSVHDQIAEASQKHAVGVSKDLREGMRRSVEILANEVIEQRLASGKAVYSGANAVEPRELTTQCLRYLYRLIVLLYAESRPELGVLPVHDEAYLAGYSVDRLRELLLVDLVDDKSKQGRHFQDSLDLLFHLVNEGYHREGAQLTFAAQSGGQDARSHEDYLEFPGLDATIFDPGATKLLNEVVLRNEALQQVLRLLMVSAGKKRDDQAGFISYAELGINQLGAVYEGLMAYTGFFAKEDLVEVAKNGDPSDGTWMVRATDVDDYPPEVFVTRTDPETGRVDRVTHAKGTFVYRLAGRDRQRSASYYTPEVLTQCVVRHALAELLGTDDHARVPGGSAGITRAAEILDLTICEPALGSGAFLNEAINQLSAEYLKRRQDELGEVLDAERYQRELQKVKAHFALHQCYGVDLNATAVELAEVSLWLNCMHPGLKAPWFGLQLRRGNSLIGCRRATWTTGQLFGKPPNGGVWAREKAAANKPVVPPTDRPLAEPLGPDEVHHFLLPGHGWGVVSGRKEAKELAPEAAKALGEWRKAILKAPSARDKDRLVALANGVERLWTEAADVLEALHHRMRRPLGLYGTDTDAGAPDDDRRRAEAILANTDSSLGRLRLIMDAWVGLWFWPLSPELSGISVARPSWQEWLAALEAIVGPEPTAPTGQLDLFDDLAAIAAIEEARAADRVSVAEVLADNPWLSLAQRLARQEGAWHWQLEFAPVFQRGGFDLQVGNPPWVRLDWREDVVLAEFDPWWGLVEQEPDTLRRARRSAALGADAVRSGYLSEITSAEGVVSILGSHQLRPITAGVRTNLYMLFLNVVWQHLSDGGTIGFLTPEGHLMDPSAGRVRAAAYSRLRRLFLFPEARRWFEDLEGQMTTFSVATYGLSNVAASFLMISAIQGIEALDGSLSHDGYGELPGLQYPSGGWDTRPHRARILDVDNAVLADWSKLFGSPDAPPHEARLLRPVTKRDLEAISALAGSGHRLADERFHWTPGLNESNSKRDGIIEWRTTRPGSLEDVILQGPHFSIAQPIFKESNEGCKNNLDYSEVDLESLGMAYVPRTNYQRATSPGTFREQLGAWDGHGTTEYWRVAWRRMTQPGSERSLQAALIPRSVSHVGTVCSAHIDSAEKTCFAAGVFSSIPLDYLVKISSRSDLWIDALVRFPLPSSHLLSGLVVSRTLRLNCLTAAYSALWAELFVPSRADDRWAISADSRWGPVLARVPLGDVGSTWTMETPLRRDAERRMALVEIDALAALMLGLSAEQLCAMYRTQFAVLRKYEYAMAFDQEGRKVCQHHQSAGYRQSQLQQRAKDGEIDKKWKNVWQLVLAEEEEPGSVDWEGHYAPPFVRPDREAEMTRAYEVFSARMVDAG